MFINTFRVNDGLLCIACIAINHKFCCSLLHNAMLTYLNFSMFALCMISLILLATPVIEIHKYFPLPPCKKSKKKKKKTTRIKKKKNSIRKPKLVH